MKHLSTQMKQQQIEWRRAKILELSSQGYSEREIAEKLQPLANCTVHRDLVYLRKQARENLQYHIHDRIPEEYQNCMTGLKRIIRLTTEIADTVADPKTKLQAFAQLSDGYKYIMDLTTGGIIVTDAIKYVQGQMDHLKNSEKALLQDIKQKGDKEAEQQDEVFESQKTTNGIF